MEALFGKDVAACFNYSKMNRVQERVLPRAYKSNGNLVVCSPTGSGKTSVFEAAFLRHWRANEGSGKYGKVVYLAPLNALLHERSEDWSERFSRLGLKFAVLKDVEDDYQSFMSHDVSLCTPEKWDAFTRNSLDALGSVGLLVVDEIHTLADGIRGSTLESVITRMMYCCSNYSNTDDCSPLSVLLVTNANVLFLLPIRRIVAASATLPNIKDVGHWIGCSDDMIFEFGFEYRPDLKVIGLQSFGNEFLFEKNMDQRVPDVLRNYSKGRPALIFCSSRKSAASLATVLCDRPLVALSQQQKQMLLAAQKNIQNKTLQFTISRGIGIHHAALHENDKLIVQSLFKRGVLPILCSLAIGVNMPAHLVIVKSTKHYQGKSGFKEYSPLSVLQMLGRAGRPGYDTSGVAVIMTDKANEGLYQHIIEKPLLDPIESCLLLSAQEVVNCEVSLGIVQDLSQLIQWLQVQKSPKVWTNFQTTFFNHQHRLSTSNIDAAEAIATDTVKQLHEYNMLECVEDTYFEPTSAGRIASLYCLRLANMLAIMELCQSKCVTTETLLTTVANQICHEVPLRRHDKATLNKINQAFAQYRLKGAAGKYLVQTDQMKCNLLLQIALGRISVEDDYLALEIQSCVENAQRIVRAAVEYFVECDLGCEVITAFLFWRSLYLKLWENSPATFRLQQIHGIDANVARRLDSNGIQSIRQLRATSVQRLTQYLQLPMNVCSSLISEAKAILDLRLSVTDHLIKDQVEISILNGQDVQIHRILEQPQSGYILLVFTKSKILLHVRDIVSQSKYFVQAAEGISVSIHLLHTAYQGMDDRVEVMVGANDVILKKVEHRSLQQATIPQVIQRARLDQGPNPSRMKSNAAKRSAAEPILIPMSNLENSLDDNLPAKKARIDFSRFKWDAGQAPQPHIVAPMAPTQDDIESSYSAYIPHDEGHIESSYPACIPHDEEVGSWHGMSLEDEFMQFIF
ncbi:hypothetical protein AeMF1_019437 [Aphanomyces euteiches]|nr:hypothetical protein AeMF1_019437 [Aphanomyces euteiches]KAH9188634.1 hypothetical protein AeNC1_009384 [Aphanomyces euteiches]